MSEKILIPQTRLVEAKEFPVSGKSTRQDIVLKECSDAGYNPLFMPELIRARTVAPKKSRLWQTWWTSPGPVICGKIGKEEFVVVSHVPNYFSENPQRITDEINNKSLIRGAGRFPQEELERLACLSEGTYVIPRSKLKECKNGEIYVDDALLHPLVIPFLGVPEDEAGAFLTRYKEVYARKTIRVFFPDDFLSEDQQPLARFLFLGDCNDGLGGSGSLSSGGRFLGVSGEAGIAHDQGDNLVKIVSDYIGPEHQSKIVESLRGLYPSEEQIRTVLEPHFGGTPFFDEIISRVHDQYQ